MESCIEGEQPWHHLRAHQAHVAGTVVMHHLVHNVHFVPAAGGLEHNQAEVTLCACAEAVVLPAVQPSAALAEAPGPEVMASAAAAVPLVMASAAAEQESVLEVMPDHVHVAVQNELHVGRQLLRQPPPRVSPHPWI